MTEKCRDAESFVNGEALSLLQVWLFGMDFV